MSTTKAISPLFRFVFSTNVLIERLWGLLVRQHEVVLAFRLRCARRAIRIAAQIHLDEVVRPITVRVVQRAVGLAEIHLAIAVLVFLAVLQAIPVGVDVEEVRDAVAIGVDGWVRLARLVDHRMPESGFARIRNAIGVTVEIAEIGFAVAIRVVEPLEHVGDRVAVGVDVVHVGQAVLVGIDRLSADQLVLVQERVAVVVVIVDIGSAVAVSVREPCDVSGTGLAGVVRLPIRIDLVPVRDTVAVAVGVELVRNAVTIAVEWRAAAAQGVGLDLVGDGVAVAVGVQVVGNAVAVGVEVLRLALDRVGDIVAVRIRRGAQAGADAARAPHATRTAVGARGAASARAASSCRRAPGTTRTSARRRIRTPTAGRQKQTRESQHNRRHEVSAHHPGLQSFGRAAQCSRAELRE